MLKLFDCQHVWYGTEQMQGNECWGVPFEQYQTERLQCQYVQQQMMTQEVPQMMTMANPQMMVRPTPQQTADQELMLPTAPHIATQQIQMTPMSFMSGDSTPSDVDRCMAFLMTQGSNLQCDKDIMAAQLKAAADCQCYED